jgi:hypothetical protein
MIKGKKITDRMRKLAHVPIQPWKGWNPNDLFGGWFSTLGRYKTQIGTMGLLLDACLILPSLVLLVLQSIRTITEVTIERKMAAHMLSKHQRGE